jgi:hypothetical protein
VTYGQSDLDYYSIWENETGAIYVWHHGTDSYRITGYVWHDGALEPTPADAFMTGEKLLKLIHKTGLTPTHRYLGLKTRRRKRAAVS